MVSVEQLIKQQLGEKKVFKGERREKGGGWGVGWGEGGKVGRRGRERKEGGRRREEGEEERDEVRGEVVLVWHPIHYILHARQEW